jgi:hypothetical protein
MNVTNSILTTLASINATVIGILLGVFIALFLYSYQILSQTSDKLNDLRWQVANIMHLKTFYKPKEVNLGEYTNSDGLVNLPKIKVEIFRILTSQIVKNLMQEGTNEGKLEQKEEVKKLSNSLFGLTYLLSISYPYSNLSIINSKGQTIFGEPKRIDYDPGWQNDLINTNNFLCWIWRYNKNKCMELILTYRQILKEEHLKEILAENKENKSIKREAKINVNLINHIYDIEFEKIISDFFEKVIFIEDTIIPQIKDLSFKMNVFEKQFNIKQYSIIILIFSFFMLIVGIFLPLYIYLYWKPPYIKSVELTLLIIYVISYAVPILIFLKKAVGMKFQ